MAEMKTVFIDPGHGGQDPGAVGRGSLPVFEKALNLEIAWNCMDHLKECGFEVTMSRIDDSRISLEERAQFANCIEADAFVSIHCNSSANPAAEGIETHVWEGTIISEPLAAAIQSSLVSTFTDHADRGIRRSDIYVLKHTEMIAALVECEFLSNARQAEFLLKSTYPLGRAIAEGIIAYFNDLKT